MKPDGSYAKGCRDLVDRVSILFHACNQTVEIGFFQRPKGWFVQTSTLSEYLMAGLCDLSVVGKR
jgi:hypothetical protein